MIRSTTLFLLLGLPSLTLAQDRQPGDPVPLLLSGINAPVPSLKYRLAHDRREMVPGNAATLYYRSHAILYENSALLQELKALHWSEWVGTPLSELPRKEIKEKLHDARHVFHELDLAGRRRDCDWQLDGRDEGVSLLLPEIQGFRSYATVLAVKARLEIAEGRFADAVETLRSGLTLGRNIAQGPTLIHVLVGIAVSQIMLRQLEDLIQQPEAPNLYWALTVLPQPFIDPRKAIIEESGWLEGSLPFLKGLEARPMTLAEEAAAVASIRKMQNEIGLRPPKEVEMLAMAAFIQGAHKDSKRTLIKGGLKPEVVEPMPAFQAVSLLAYREYCESREELLKWMYVPEGRKHPAYQEAVKRNDRATDRLDMLFFHGLIRGLGALASPSYDRVFDASHRLDRHLATIRGVEALRLHAAAHNRWPAKLDDIKAVPMPLDPVTGKAFDYRLRDENHAVLSTPSAEPKERADMRYVYHMALRK